jgi:hypothetical protein
MVIFTTMLFLSTALLLLASASAGCEPNDVNPNAVLVCMFVLFYLFSILKICLLEMRSAV